MTFVQGERGFEHILQLLHLRHDGNVVAVVVFVVVVVDHSRF